MKTFLSTVVKLAVTALLLWWVIVRTGVDFSGIRHAHLPLLALAVGVFIVSNILGAWQWKMLLRGQKIDFPFTRALKLYFIGIFFNSFLPGALGGDVVKIYSISRVEKRGREGLAATFVDRFAGFFLLALFALAGSGWLLATGAPAVKRDIVDYIFLVFGLFIAASAVLFSRRLFKLIYEVILGRLNTLSVVSKFRESHEFFHLYRHQYGLAGKVFLMSLAIQLLRVAVHYICALSIGFEISFIYYLVFIPLVALVAIIPVSFGGLGVRENTAPILFTSVAAIATIDNADVLVVTTQLLASLVGIGVGLIGGVVFVLTRQTTGGGNGAATASVELPGRIDNPSSESLSS